MNKEILEFWGNVLIQAARNQRMLEDIAKWVHSGYEIMNVQNDFWTALREKGRISERGAVDAAMRDRDSEEYRKAYREFLKIFGMVSMEDYQEVLRKNEALEKRLEESRRTIQKTPMTGKGVIGMQREMEKGLQELVDKQSEQFKELMESIREFYSRDIPDR